MNFWINTDSSPTNRRIIDFYLLITDSSLIITNSSPTHYRFLIDSSSTHHDHRCSPIHHRLIIDASWSSIFTDLSPTNHRLIIDASLIFTDSWLIFTNHHWLITDSSPTHYQFITDSSPTHHWFITDSSPTHHWRIMIIDFHRLIIDASWTSIYTDSSHSAATTFCSEDILQRLFCCKYILRRRHSAININ